MKKPILVLSIVLILCLPAFSFVPQPTPTLQGTTGLIRMPSADVIPYKNFDFGMDLGPVAFTDRWTLLYKMSLGTFQGMELGAVGTDDQQGGLKEGVFINMKYSLATDTSPYPLLLAIGCENLTSKTLSDVYMVATRYLQNGSRIHFGFIGDFVSTEAMQSKFRPVGALGFDTPVLWDNMYGIIEMFAGDTVFQLDLGARWYVNETFAVNLSAVNILEQKDTPADNYRDPKSVLIGFSWINPL